MTKSFALQEYGCHMLSLVCFLHVFYFLLSGAYHVFACGPKTVPVKRTFLNIAIVGWGGVGGHVNGPCTSYMIYCHAAKISGIAYYVTCCYAAGISGIVYYVTCRYAAEISGIVYYVTCRYAAEISGIVYYVTCCYAAEISGIVYYVTCCYAAEMSGIV